MITAQGKRDAILAFFYFFASTAITWWFIVANQDVYNHNLPRMLVSCGIAGGKWGLQIVAAFLFLKTQRWKVLKRIGLTCFIGSVILLPGCLPAISNTIWFLYLLILSVLTMIVLYFLSVRKSGLGLFWFFGWIICLAIAITLQVNFVFDDGLTIPLRSH